MRVGIDLISFYTSHYYLDLAILAERRGVDPNKFYIGLGQRTMAIATPDEDVVTLGANAAVGIVQKTNLDDIDTVLFATETGVDQSKSAGLYVHRLLGLSPQCRVLELKQACYSATGALQLILPKIIQSPHKKVLLIAADISRYGFNKSGESSQGCGAVALLLSVQPQLLAIEAGSGVYSEEIMDFWRPNYLNEAIVDGQYSSKLYINCLQKTWHAYTQQTHRRLDDHDYFCYHNSIPRLVEKAHLHLMQMHSSIFIDKEVVKKKLDPMLEYGRKTGNSYSASLYISLISLLDTVQSDLSNRRIGFYSYGSGCVAEFFSGIVQPNYQQVLDTAGHQSLLNSREALSYEFYEAFYNFRFPQDGSYLAIPKYQKGTFRLIAMDKHQRIYGPNI